MLIAAPSGAGAATEIGSTFDPGTSSCGNLTLQSGSPPADTYAAPAAGVITSWSYQANASEIPVQLQLKVGRPAGTNQFTIVGESAVETASSLPLNAFTTGIPVLAGDLIGIRPVTNGLPCIRAMSGYSYSAYVMGDDLSPGTTGTFNSPVSGIQLDVSATLETTTCKGMPPTMAGTPGPDTLTGTPNADVIVGLEGRDTISGLAGNDVECGGTGKDTLMGGGGRDKLLGQGGNDKLKGGGAKDLCTGGKGNDSASACEKERSI